MPEYPPQGHPPQYYPPPQQKQPGLSTGVKIGIGIVVGILLAMGGCVACSAFLISKTARQVQETQQDRERTTAAAIALLKFEDVKASTQYGYTKISGRVRNTSNMTFEWVKIGVDWREKAGQIVDSDFTYLVAGEALQPGAAKTFEIMGKEDKRAKEYSLKILEAR